LFLKNKNMKCPNIREEELKNKIAQDFFWLYDCTRIIGNVDFCVSMLQSNREQYEQESLLWAEAKKDSSDVYKSLVQLILTIGKARTFDKYLPPAFLGAFDSEKIAFIPYSEIHYVFYLNDFNWNVTPSNYDTKEFKLIYGKVKDVIDNKMLLFNYIKDDIDLKRFIKTNFTVSKSGVTKTKIDKNNFMIIYNKWLEAVKPTIGVNWEAAKKINIIDGDFYLADLLSIDNETIKAKLSVLLKKNIYKYNRQTDDLSEIFREAFFNDNQKAHIQFWNRYERPPKEDYWDYIMNRRDLLVPQDIRERKGTFFTPQIWVELSQKYLADVLGEDWQDEYYVWDCCAGTGNLLAGLTNKYNIWASTLDKQDVDVMKDRIENGANLLESHVFQFDFLNDAFTKLPQGLQDIINDEKKRKKLVIYINPPYAEATSTATRVGTKENKSGVAVGNKTHAKYFDKLGKARNELFAQFLARIYFEIESCKIGEFSTQKALIAPNFKDFRKFFLAKLKKCFIVPADTFDNVKGKFPIGFKIWDTVEKKHFQTTNVDIYLKNGAYHGKKTFSDGLDCQYINDWVKKYRDKNSMITAKLCYVGNDFQNNIKVQICSSTKEVIAHDVVFNITQNNLIPACIYFAVRKVIKATWLNDRDQFLYPNNDWKKDIEFQNDCLAYTLFNNNIQSKYGVNHWIPFTEYAVGAKERFASRFMTDFIEGKTLLEPIVSESNIPYLLFAERDDFEGGGSESADYKKPMKRVFSETAKNVFKAGRELWKYYHAQKFPSLGGVDAEGGRGGYNVNASLYDIREYFQGRNEKGTMNNKSDDEKYNELIENLRSALKSLAEKIEPKVYEYGFLK